MNKLKSIFIKSGLTTLLIVPSMMYLYAQDAATSQAASPTSGAMSTQEWMLLTVIILTIVVAVLVLLTSIAVLKVMQTVLVQSQPEGAAAPEGILAGWWKGVMAKLTRVVPLDKEETIALDHDYDGIRELDNHLPPWWLYGFYFTIVFAIVYMLLFHVIQPESFPLSSEEYKREMQAAAISIAEYKKANAENIDEASVTLITEDQTALGEGAEIFAKNCAVCHGDKGQGVSAPNLTDEFWKHGGGIKNVFSTIKYGVLDKGMQNWDKKLRPSEIQKVASFILSLEKVSPADGGKDPEGEKYEEAEEEAAE